MCQYFLEAQPSDKDFKRIYVEFDLSRTQVSELSNAYEFLKTTSLSNASLQGDVNFKLFNLRDTKYELKTDQKFKPLQLIIDRNGLISGKLECAHYPLIYTFDISSVSELSLKFRLPSDEQVFMASQEAIRCLFGQDFDEEKCRNFFRLGNMPRHHFREILASKLTSSPL